MNLDEIKVKETLRHLKKQYFVNSYQATDEETLGMLVAHLMEFNGVKILDVSAKALEDANFHSEVKKIDSMKDALVERPW